MKSLLALLILLAALSSGAQAHRRLLLANRQAEAAGGGGGGSITLVSTSAVNRDNASDNPETWSFTMSAVTSGYVLVSVAMYGDGNPTTPTFNGNAMTALVGITNGTDSNQRIYMLGLTVGNLGAGTYTVSVGGFGARQFVGYATAWSGVNQTTPTGNSAAATGNSTSPSITVSSATGNVVVDVVGYKGLAGNSYTKGASQTLIASNDDNSTNEDTGTSYAAGAASVNMTATLGAAVVWAHAGIELKP